MTDNPRTVEEIFQNYSSRKLGLLRALTDDVDDFYQQCDPERENLCLYGEPNGSWSVELPAEEVPPELPDPCLGINFARDGMQRKDWLALVAVHSDAWLMSVAYFHGAKLDQTARATLFNLINQSPTLFEVVAGKASAASVLVGKRPFPAAVQPNKRVRRDTGPAIRNQPCGRMLTYDDVGTDLQGRQGEMYWPDDGTWYLVDIVDIDPRRKSARIQYPQGETEDLDLDEIIREGHMTLID